MMKKTKGMYGSDYNYFKALFNPFANKKAQRVTPKSTRLLCTNMTGSMCQKKHRVTVSKEHRTEDPVSKGALCPKSTESMCPNRTG